jgi:PhoH-like ATPase
MKGMFYDDIPDHRILSTAIWVRDTHPDRFVALVTKDINLRIKSKAAGMEVQDYLTDRIEDENVENANREVQILDRISADLVQKLAYGPENAIPWEKVAKEKPRPNQLYKFKWDKEIVCGRYDEARKKIVLVKSHNVYGIKPRNDEQKFAIDACLNPEILLVSMTGGAGTGKTLIALASALEQARDYDQIILTRPTVILGNQEIGFLPGDEKAKMSPFIQPLMDNFNVIKSQFRPSSKEALRLDAMLREEKLIISPLAYIRGRSLGRVFLICDEAQNLTPHEVKTIITRAGEGTKMVFNGDIFQIDQPYLDQWSNGLSHLNEKMEGQRLFEHIFLRVGERSELSDIAAKLL